MRTAPDVTQVFAHPWFFRGQLPVASGTMVEIQGARFSYLHRAFEARAIVDSVTRITYRADTSMQLGEPPWRDWHLCGHVNQAVVELLQTRFVLSP